MSGVQRIGGLGNGAATIVPAGTRIRSKQRWMLGELGFPLTVGVVIAAAIVTVCVMTGTLYHQLAYGDLGLYGSFAAIGMLIAFLYTLPFVFRSELGADRFLSQRARFDRLLINWTWAFIALGVVAFLTKSTATYSRGWVVLFYLVGGLTVIGLELVIRSAARWALEAGRIARQRLMLIGSPEEIQRVTAAQASTRSTVEIVTVAAIPSAAIDPTSADGEALLRDIIDRAVLSARAHEIDSVVLLSDWSHVGFVDTCVAAFSMLPVSIHLDAGRLAKRFRGIRVKQIGPVGTLSLTEAPIGALQALAKRCFDIAVATAALFVLSGVFAIVAILIKRDSPGPVFFRQRRLGYNQREFRIYKFRSMTSQDDGDQVLQAQRNDPRITRVGRCLRRFNIDELPQLINVLKGEMSIVGPRPHAVAHDRLFEKRIGLYPRRLNVRPGITGWAQVHGLRGETDTDNKMVARVDHDLYYIDNWSIWLDCYIVALTVLSPKAYTNAV